MQLWLPGARRPAALAAVAGIQHVTLFARVNPHGRLGAEEFARLARCRGFVGDGRLVVRTRARPAEDPL